MNVLERIKHAVGGFSQTSQESMTANGTPFEVVPVNAADILKRGSWINAAGQKLRIDHENGVLIDYDSNEELLVNLVNTKDLENKLIEGGYVFVPATADALSGSNVEQLAEKIVSAESVQPTKIENEAVESDESIEKFLESTDTQVELINAALQEAQAIVDEGGFPAMQSIIDEIAARVTAAVKTVNELSVADDTANELAEKDGALGDDYMVSKQERLKKVEALSEEIALLAEHASMTIKSLKKLQQQSLDIKTDETVPQEESVPDARRQKELAVFLERPEGQEVIDTYRMIVSGEWEKFTEILGRSKTKISHDKAVDIWEQDVRFLPLIRARITTDLAEKHGITKDQADDIFLDILEGLDEEYLKRQESQKSKF